MTNEELIVQRLDQLESQIQPLTAFARAAGELREELAPRVNEAVSALIAELADVEADFRVEDLVFLVKKLMRNINNLNFALDQFKNLVDFALTAEPLLKTSVPQLISYVDNLEQNGVFRLITVGTEVLKKVGSTYSVEEMRQIGDGLVHFIGILKKLTAPAALDLLDRAAELPARVDVTHAQPVGFWGMIGAMGDKEIQQGLGVLMEITKGLATLKTQP
ncbi:MAG: DUF1641 domain-containing protein [Deltaproteobacteria bacterium]|nr:DUF1641 domain-containing protein [Deltaproteobacteria bacterium]